MSAKILFKNSRHLTRSNKILMDCGPFPISLRSTFTNHQVVPSQLKSMSAMRDSQVQKCSSIPNLSIKTGKPLQMRLLIMLFNHAQWIIDVSCTRMSCFLEEAHCLLDLDRNFRSLSSNVQTIDWMAILKWLDINPNQLKQKSRTTWSRDMQYGSAEVFSDLIQASPKFAIAKPNTTNTVHLSADTTVFSTKAELFIIK